MTLPATDILKDIAQEASVVFEGRCSLPLFSARYPSFTLEEAYRVSALANKMRLGEGYRPVGRKAGFTNSRIWDEYGVRAPNWGYVYDRTLHDLAFIACALCRAEDRARNHRWVCRRAVSGHG